MSEAGLPGFTGGSWWGLLAPKKTPKSVINRLHKEVVAILKSDTVNKRFADLGAHVVGDTPEEFARFIEAQGRQSTELARRIGLEPE
jgi:tripartite-type tricarboxylate transporter receptor subunit TctC